MAEQPPEEGGRTPPDGRGPRLNDVFWIGTACALAIILGGGIGYALDDAFNTAPWLTIAGLAFGVISAVLLAVNQFRRYL